LGGGVFWAVRSVVSCLRSSEKRS